MDFGQHVERVRQHVRDVVGGIRPVSDVGVQARLPFVCAGSLVTVEGLHEVQHRGLAVDVLLERVEPQSQRRHHLLGPPRREDVVELANGGPKPRSSRLLQKRVHGGLRVVKCSGEWE